MESNYAVHVTDFAASLSSGPWEGGVRAALTRLAADGLAQVVSFLGPHALSHNVRTLSAVNPQLRLDVEALTSRPCVGDASKARAEGDGVLVFAAAATERATPRVRLVRSLWWAARCGLPLALEVDNTRSDVLALLPDSLRRRVAALSVHVFSAADCMRCNEPGLCNGSCGTFLCALATFPNIARLSVVCRATAKSEAVAFAVQRALRVAARMPISEVNLHGVPHLHDLSALSNAPHLRILTAQRCGVRSVAGLLSCPLLSVLDVSNNRELRTLAGLAGAAQLECLAARDCGLENLDDVCCCRRLRELDVAGNTALEGLDGLAGAPCLERVAARCCGLLSVGALNCCPWLCDVDVSHNRHLGDLRGLSGAPCLRRVGASGCELRSVDGLGGCPRLAEVNVSSNVALQDLSCLAGAPRLQRVTAVKCDLRGVDGLARCPLLLELTVHHNCLLADLSGVAGAPRLEKLTAWNCGLRSIDGLGSCPRLREVALFGNAALDDLGDLVASTSLRRLNVAGLKAAAAHRFAAAVEVTF